MESRLSTLQNTVFKPMQLDCFSPLFILSALSPYYSGLVEKIRQSAQGLFFPLSVCLQLFGQNLAVELPSRALIYFDNVGLGTCASPLSDVGEKGGAQPSCALVLQSCMCLSKGPWTLPKGPWCICYRCDVRYKILT